MWRRDSSTRARCASTAFEPIRRTTACRRSKRPCRMSPISFSPTLRCPASAGSNCAAAFARINGRAGSRCSPSPATAITVNHRTRSAPAPRARSWYCAIAIAGDRQDRYARASVASARSRRHSSMPSMPGTAMSVRIKIGEILNGLFERLIAVVRLIGDEPVDAQRAAYRTGASPHRPRRRVSAADAADVASTGERGRHLPR